MAIWIGFLALLSMSVVAACQAPAGGQPSGPVAPAIETDHPDHDSPIPLPSSLEPIAPAIELEHPDAESPIPLAPPTEAP